MCLDIFGAWINPKTSFDWDIILENRAFFAKNDFLTQKRLFVMDQIFTIKHFPCTETLIPMYRFMAYTLF